MAGCAPASGRLVRGRGTQPPPGGRCRFALYFVGSEPPPALGLAGFAGRTSGCRPTALLPEMSCARHGACETRTRRDRLRRRIWNEPARRWRASPCLDGVRTGRRSPTSGTSTPHALWRHPGSARLRRALSTGPVVACKSSGRPSGFTSGAQVAARRSIADRATCWTLSSVTDDRIVLRRSSRSACLRQLGCRRPCLFDRCGGALPPPAQGCAGLDVPAIARALDGAVRMTSGRLPSDIPGQGRRDPGESWEAASPRTTAFPVGSEDSI